ncbi:hypothetical protein E2C01_033867 [Portunus trituberculatus]|uniref:Uncharacterized protein n=1 Tax=Portunus trituberculatus TaxID=210409 RepID=A0A5B7EZZ9_PORTR|nr:hypothetical protein [Portunus trituberculatus]
METRHGTQGCKDFQKHTLEPDCSQRWRLTEPQLVPVNLPCGLRSDKISKLTIAHIYHLYRNGDQVLACVIPASENTQQKDKKEVTRIRKNLPDIHILTDPPKNWSPSSPSQRTLTAHSNLPQLRKKEYHLHRFLPRSVPRDSHRRIASRDEGVSGFYCLVKLQEVAALRDEAAGKREF